MSVIMHENYTLVTRHPIILLHHFAKCIFLLAVSITVLLAIFHYKGRIPNDFITLVLFPIALLLMNYAFMKFILALVSYYNKIVIIAPDKIIIIDSTLLLQEDIEVIDLAKVVKIDVECHGILSAILGFGHFIIEQQRNDVRTMHFISRPYEILHLIKERTNYIDQAKGEMKSEIY